MSLSGKHALITGSSRGIGRGIAWKLAEKGVRVAVHYFENENAAKETLAGIKKRGSDGFLVQADVSRHEQVTRMLDRVKSQFGGVDIFVSNARTELPTFYHEPLEIPLEKWDTAVNSQAKAFLVGAQQAAAMMADGGRIIAITYAPGGRTGSWQPWVAMGAAKAALESLCRYFAVALAPRGITVNILSPGLVEDTVLNSLPQPVMDLTRSWHESGWTPMGRLGTIDDIGNAAALLCSEEAGWITGQLIAVDGGASLMDTGFPLEIQGSLRKKTAAAK
jgi:enoyl-[acyl-carrier protein] reductase III